MRRLALIAPLVLAAAAEAGPGLWFPGHAPDTEFGWVTALSQGGGIAAGYNFGTDFQKPNYAPGFTWTQASGRYDFGLEEGLPPTTAALGINSDGGTLVGYTRSENVDRRAFRRLPTGVMEDLGLLPNEQRSYATGISGDGQIVVGTCEHGQSDFAGKAFRWTAGGGMKSLGFLKPNSNFSKAYGISRDGSTIVGTSQTNQLDRDAYRWTEGEGMVELPDLPGGPYEWSEALAINADGSVIVGYSPAADKLSHAVRWVNGVVQDLSPDFKHNMQALAVDDSGDIVGGRYSVNGQNYDNAFVWTLASGIIDLETLLADHGIVIPDGYHLSEIMAITGDGLTFAGKARNQVTGHSEGFVATIPAPSTIVLMFAPCFSFRRRRG